MVTCLSGTASWALGIDSEDADVEIREALSAERRLGNKKYKHEQSQLEYMMKDVSCHNMVLMHPKL
jgi:hypothetical protein